MTMKKTSPPEEGITTTATAGHSFDRRPREDREDRGGSYEKRPFKREGKPFERRERSFDRKNKPFDRERKPFERERKPFGKNRKFDRYDEED